MGKATACADCCAFHGFLGTIFFGLLTYMAFNKNEVFLDHKGPGIEKAKET